MPTIRSQLPYLALFDPANCSPLLSKVQALVSTDDKRTLLASLGGDDAVLSYVIQYAFKRSADFIRANQLNNYSSSNHQRILDFIRDGTDSCASGHTDALHDVGAGAHSEPASSNPRRVGSVAVKTASGRSKAKTKS